MEAHDMLVEQEACADQRSLREMELLKAELLATVSHELRSPLASIKGYAATLLRHERRISREERHEFLLAISEACDRLTWLVERLLELSQLETGSITLMRTPVNLAYLVRETLTAREQRFVASRGEGMPGAQQPYVFSVHLHDRFGNPTNEEPTIWADRRLLREVLDNLLDNAISYTPDGGTIEVHVRPGLMTAQTAGAGLQSDVDHDHSRPFSSAGTRQMVEVCVRDNGIGIPPHYLRRIFDRFYRVDTRLTRETGGLGIGLSICQRIVELHGGSIWAESEVGQGSAFHVWLPADEANS